MAGFLTCLALARLPVGSAVAYAQGICETYSSGYCAGLSPGFPLEFSEEDSHHKIGCKITIFF